MIKAIKIALLYWLRQALLAFCPHEGNVESRRYHTPVCPNCALWVRVYDALSSLCGMQAIYRLPKCDFCREPLASSESGMHSACVAKESARTQVYDLPI